MDELRVLKARVIILERQMEQMNIQLRKFIEDFEEFRHFSRPLSPPLTYFHPLSPPLTYFQEEEDDLS